MAELGSLISVLLLVRRRIFFNQLLAELAKPFCAALVVVLATAAVAPDLIWSALAAAVAFPAAAAISLSRALQRRIALYDAAIRLDREAALKDRLSTAFFFSGIENPEGLLKLQRRDALSRLATLQPLALFPLRWPAGARRVAFLMAAVAALLAYRASFGPPVTALLHKAAQTQLVKAMLSPIAHAMETRAAAAQSAAERSRQMQNGEPSAREQADLRGASADGPGRASREKGEAGSDTKSEAGERQQPSADQGSNAEGEQAGAEGGEQQDRDQNGERQNRAGDSRSGQPSTAGSENNSNRAGDQQQDQAGSDASESREPSLARSLMQALKNMLNRATGGQQNQARGDKGQSPSQNQSQNGQQSANTGNRASQNGQNGERDAESPSQSSSGMDQPGGQKAGNGVGQQPGSEQASGAAERAASSLKPERVSLQPQSFNGEAQVRARPGEGAVKTPARNAGPTAAARAAGAEQENVPLRYRLYVQRYFDQTSKTEKK